jgi:hypothetical protein
MSKDHFVASNICRAAICHAEFQRQFFAQPVSVIGWANALGREEIDYLSEIDVPLTNVSFRQDQSSNVIRFSHWTVCSPPVTR